MAEKYFKSSTKGDSILPSLLVLLMVLYDVSRLKKLAWLVHPMHGLMAKSYEILSTGTGLYNPEQTRGRPSA